MSNNKEMNEFFNTIDNFKPLELDAYHDEMIQNVDNITDPNDDLGCNTDDLKLYHLETVLMGKVMYSLELDYTEKLKRCDELLQRFRHKACIRILSEYVIQIDLENSRK